MNERDKEILIETLEYFLDGLKDVETATNEQQPKIYELEYLIPLVKNLPISDVEARNEQLLFSADDIEKIVNEKSMFNGKQFRKMFEK